MNKYEQRINTNANEYDLAKATVQIFKRSDETDTETIKEFTVIRDNASEP